MVSNKNGSVAQRISLSRNPKPEVVTIAAREVHKKPRNTDSRQRRLSRSTSAALLSRISPLPAGATTPGSLGMGGC